MVIELSGVQFWSEIILVISNRTRAARSFDFEITHSTQFNYHYLYSDKTWVFDQSERAQGSYLCYNRV